MAWRVTQALSGPLCSKPLMPQLRRLASGNSGLVNNCWMPSIAKPMGARRALRSRS